MFTGRRKRRAQARQELVDDYVSATLGRPETDPETRQAAADALVRKLMMPPE